MKYVKITLFGILFAAPIITLIIVNIVTYAVYKLTCSILDSIVNLGRSLYV